MASKAELLASARKKGQKQQIFRRGRGTTTSVRQPAVDRNAGREAKAVSDFLGTMLKFGPGVLDAHNRETNEENKKLVAKGEATYKNATPDQRKQFRDNVRNGTISGGESPYFREGLRRSHADAIALEYGNSVMLAWESSEAKNSADPEAFNNFLDEFQNKSEGPPGRNRSWQERIGDLGDHVANEEFWPKADAFKRQLSQMHSEHQRSEYNKKAKDTKTVSEYGKLNSTVDKVLSEDTVSQTKIKEELQDSTIRKYLNVVDPKNHVPVPTDRELRFIKGFDGTRKEAKLAYKTEVSKIKGTLDHHIETVIGKDGAIKTFSLAAFNKEDKRNDPKKYRTRTGETQVASTGGSTPKFGANMKLDFIPTPVEVSEKEELGLANLLEPEKPSDSYSQIHGQPESAQWILSQGPEMDKKLKVALQAAPSKSISTIAPKVESDKQVDVSIMTALHAEKEIALAKGEPAEDQVATVETEASVVQPMHQEEESVQTAMMKAIEGIEPHRTSYGLVAYKTEDEAQRMVDKIRDGIDEKKTGGWEFAITKVGKVYQVQTQGGATMTDKQKTAFFDKLASEYPGQMGNLEGKWPKDKDFVQVIKGK
jgi:hypothetical protein